VQLINAVDFSKKMSKSLGNKRNEISNKQIAEITKIYGDFVPNEFSKIFDNKDFGYAKVTIERPERNAKGQVVTDKRGNPKPDSSLRDTENVPLTMDLQEYMEKEVLPHVPDAWVDESKTNIGYEVNFTKYFYQYKPLRSLDDIRKDIMAIEQETDGLLKEVIG
jgi:type I restriction enzyme M protein